MELYIYILGFLIFLILAVLAGMEIKEAKKYKRIISAHENYIDSLEQINRNNKVLVEEYRKDIALCNNDNLLHIRHNQLLRTEIEQVNTNKQMIEQQLQRVLADRKRIHKDFLKLQNHCLAFLGAVSSGDLKIYPEKEEVTDYIQEMENILKSIKP